MRINLEHAKQCGLSIEFTEEYISIEGTRDMPKRGLEAFRLFCDALHLDDQDGDTVLTFAFDTAIWARLRDVSSSRRP